MELSAGSAQVRAGLEYDLLSRDHPFGKEISKLRKDQRRVTRKVRDLKMP